MPTNEAGCDRFGDVDDGVFYPILEHPEWVWQRMLLLHWAEMAGREVAKAAMQHDSISLHALQTVHATKIRTFFGDWDGDPNK